MRKIVRVRYLEEEFAGVVGASFFLEGVVHKIHVEEEDVGLDGVTHLGHDGVVSIALLQEAEQEDGALVLQLAQLVVRDVAAGASDIISEVEVEVQDIPRDVQEVGAGNRFLVPSKRPLDRLAQCPQDEDRVRVSEVHPCRYRHSICVLDHNHVRPVVRRKFGHEDLQVVHQQLHHVVVRRVIRLVGHEALQRLMMPLTKRLEELQNLLLDVQLRRVLVYL